MCEFILTLFCVPLLILAGIFGWIMFTNWLEDIARARAAREQDLWNRGIFK